MTQRYERLKVLRNKKGVTQKYMATLLGLKDDRTYRHYEAGNIDIPSSKTVKLADYFDVSLDYLLGRSDDATPLKKKTKKNTPSE